MAYVSTRYSYRVFCNIDHAILRTNMICLSFVISSHELVSQKNCDDFNPLSFGVILAK